MNAHGHEAPTDDELVPSSNMPNMSDNPGPMLLQIISFNTDFARLGTWEQILWRAN